MWQTVCCQRRLSKGSLSKFQKAGLLQEAADRFAACPRKVPMAKFVCGNSGPPQEYFSAIQAKPLLFSRPEAVARPTALSHTSQHTRDTLFFARGCFGVPCALNCF